MNTLNENIIAIAQIETSRNQTKINLEKHIDFIIKAASHHAKIIIFPEMSLTGYETKNAKKLSLKINDPYIQEIISTCKEYQISSMIGLPLMENNILYIATLLIHKSGKIDIYYKQNLHSEENDYFKPRNDIDNFTIENINISLSICYDIEFKNHIKKAYENKSKFYFSSIFYTENGIKDLKEKVKNYSTIYPMNYVVSNYVNEVWTEKAAGNSFFVNKNGTIIELDNKSENILFIKTNEDSFENYTLK